MNLNPTIPDLNALLSSAGIDPAVVTGLSEHSGQIARGDGFIASATDAVRAQAHAEQAVQLGASVVFTNVGVQLPDLSVPVIEVEDLSTVKAHLAQQYYGDPSSKLTCIGVTGTNGKTSIAFHLTDLLEQAGLAAGYCGTLGVGRTSDLAYDDASMTTPNAVALQRLLADFVADGLTWCALEISSHALDQERAHQVALKCGIFTNLSRDHLDYHGSMDAYAEAKSRLFTDFDLSVAVINLEDPYGQSLLAKLNDEPGLTLIGYGDASAPELPEHTNVQRWSWQRHGEAITWTTPKGEYHASMTQLNLVADYQLANLTACLAALDACGVVIDPGELQHLACVPGRMEVVRAAETEIAAPLVVVDFAHTPDALDKALSALQGRVAGQLICIVGCGGDRDAGKRPLMAQSAARLADRVVLTSDNPRSEAAEAIVEHMLAGLDEAQQTCVEIEIDRALAIRRAICSAQVEDVVLIAGKGHETYQEINGTKMPFDDREVARTCLLERINTTATNQTASNRAEESR